ncbi:6135_t:CDS:2, partial [Acaulospora colombiana]
YWVIHASGETLENREEKTGGHCSLCVAGMQPAFYDISSFNSQHRVAKEQLYVGYSPFSIHKQELDSTFQKRFIIVRRLESKCPYDLKLARAYPIPDSQDTISEQLMDSA